MIIKIIKTFQYYKTWLTKWFTINQPQLMILVIIAICFLYLRQTVYFKPYMQVSVRTAIFILWFVAQILIDLSYKLSLIIALFTFFICLILDLVGVPYWALRLTTYTYYFLVLGILQFHWENYFQKIYFHEKK